MYYMKLNFVFKVNSSNKLVLGRKNQHLFRPWFIISLIQNMLVFFIRKDLFMKESVILDYSAFQSFMVMALLS